MFTDPQAKFVTYTSFSERENMVSGMGQYDCSTLSFISAPMYIGKTYQVSK